MRPFQGKVVRWCRSSSILGAMILSRVYLGAGPTTSIHHSKSPELRICSAPARPHFASPLQASPAASAGLQRSPRLRVRRVAPVDRHLHVVAEAAGALLIGQAPAMRDLSHHRKPELGVLHAVQEETLRRARRTGDPSDDYPRPEERSVQKRSFGFLGSGVPKVQTTTSTANDYIHVFSSM